VNGKRRPVGWGGDPNGPGEGSDTHSNSGDIELAAQRARNLVQDLIDDLERREAEWAAISCAHCGRIYRGPRRVAPPSSTRRAA
jgi:hypothetical protein